MTKLRIHLLGPFEVFRDGQPLTNQDWRTQQTRTIGKILLARQGQVVSSDQLIEILWPEDKPETARNRLHVRISQLRRALGIGKSLVRTVDGGYLFTINENCWLDVLAFESALKDASRFQSDRQASGAIKAYERARDLYRGDFLAEDLYADWAIQDREFYRERFMTLLMALSEAYAQQGRYRLAIERCQQALARDPFREAIYVRLMLYHYYAGERSQSLRIYQRCCQLLADELGVTPMESTVEIAARIQEGTLWADDDAPRYPPPQYQGRLFEVPLVLSEMPLVGRDKEYAWLIEHWKNADTQVILLGGIAGIGKTRLAEAFLGYVAQSGAQVLRARIPPRERSPYAPLVTALQPLLKTTNLARLSAEKLSVLSVLFPQIRDRVSDLPVLIELPAEAERQRLYDAVTDFVAAVVEQPTLVFVDDAHRMGHVCSEILIRLTGSLTILLSYRSEEVSPDNPIKTIFQSLKAGQATLRLEILKSRDVSTLINQLAQGHLASIGEEIIKQSGGHPLYLVTLLQHMFDGGQLYVDEDGHWGVSGTEVPILPPSIRETIVARLQRLDRSQRQIFDLAAVIGGEFDFDLLQAASQREEETLLVVLDRLLDLGLMVEPRRLGQSEFAIAHDRYVEVAYETLPDVRRKQLHLQVAQAIEKVYADRLSAYYPALADHFGKAQALGREQNYATLAGEQAVARFANATALRYLSRALELTQSNEIDQRFRLLLAREKVSNLLGDRQNQMADLDELALFSDKLDLSQQAEIIWRRAAFEWITGEVDTASILSDKAVALAQSAGAVEIEASSLLLKSRCVTHDYDLSHQYLQSALTLAQENGLRAIQGDIVRNLGNIHFWQNDYVRSRTYFEEALTIHRQVGDLRGELSALNNLGHLSQLTGEPLGARDFFQLGLEICQKIGDRLAEGVILANLGGLLVALGDYEQAEIDLRHALAIREKVQNDEGVGSLLPALGDILRRQGKYIEAEKQLERALEINLRLEHPQQKCLSLDGLSQLYRDLGDYASAKKYFEQALAALDDERSPNRVRASANGCLLLHLRGENLAALEIGEQALALSQELPLTQAIALKNLGHVLSALEKYDQAQEKYQQALDLHQALIQPHLQLEPLAGLAQVVLKRGRDDRALSYVEEILPNLESALLVGPDQPILVYLSCFRVLEACQDPRSHQILRKAHKLLNNRHALITDKAARKAYLENIAAHRAILNQIRKNQ